MPLSLILSDLHLGRPEPCQPRAEHFAELVRTPGLDTLIVNGDVAETAHPIYQLAAIDEVRTLEQLCADADVRLILLAGNHDADLAELRYLHLADDRVLITHGDAFHPGIAPWSERAHQMKRETQRTHGRLPAAHRQDLDTHLAIASWVAHREFTGDFGQTHSQHETSLLRQPHNLARVAYYWATVPGLASEFAHRFAPDTRVLLFGHSHFPGVWRRDGRVLINTGSFTFPHLPHAVLSHDEQRFTYHRLKRDRRTRQYRLSPRPLLTLHPHRRRP
ncbi:MAG: metallophosphoesterase [Planctomycetota bacterium]